MVVFALTALPARAAFISEIDLGGPGGRAIEFSELDPAKSYSLLTIDASPTFAPGFGRVLGVATLPAGLGSAVGGVVMVSSDPWPGNPSQTVLLSSLPSPTTSAALNFSFTRLLILLEGQTGVQPLENVLSSPAYNAAAVQDWVLMGSGAIGSTYQANGYDIASINAALGIDLLERVADTSLGRVIGRAALPSQAIDLTQLHVGTPDGNDRFLVGQDYRYIYTPGASQDTLQAISTTPEPGVAAVLGVGLLVVSRRRRA